VCDNQTVTIQFESGIHATFGLYALSAENTRLITVLLDDAEMTGDLLHGQLTLTPLSGAATCSSRRRSRSRARTIIMAAAISRCCARCTSIWSRARTARS
jgi:hypothetical protein